MNEEFKWGIRRLLGHSSIAITEASYGKVVKRRVSDEVLRLNGRLCEGK